MSVRYKLTYFPIAGRAEVARLCFAYAGIDFEDEQLAKEEWGKRKAAATTSNPFRFPSLPVLEITRKNGNVEVVNQSLPILRYVAKITGLMPPSALGEAKVETVLEVYAELVGEYLGVMFAPDEAAKKAAAKNFRESFLSKTADLEKILSQNVDGDQQFFIGSLTSVADLAVAFICREGKQVATAAGSPVDLSSKPCLQKLVVRVSEEPRLQPYFAKRLFKYKLSYFASTGRAEAIRLCFVVGGIQFQDEHVDPAKWGEMKKAATTSNPFKFPWLPNLEVNKGYKTIVLSQSMPILRYVGSIAGLNGKDDLERASIESVLEVYSELIADYFKLKYCKDASARKAVAKEFSGVFDAKAGYLETLLSQNVVGSKKFFVGNSFKVADVAVASLCKEAKEDAASAGNALNFSNKPLLQNLVERVFALPQIKAYYSKK